MYCSPVFHDQFSVRVCVCGCPWVCADLLVSCCSQSSSCSPLLLAFPESPASQRDPEGHRLASQRWLPGPPWQQGPSWPSSWLWSFRRRPQRCHCRSCHRSQSILFCKWSGRQCCLHCFHPAVRLQTQTSPSYCPSWTCFGSVWTCGKKRYASW